MEEATPPAPSSGGDEALKALAGLMGEGLLFKVRSGCDVGSTGGKALLVVLQGGGRGEGEGGGGRGRGREGGKGGREGAGYATSTVQGAIIQHDRTQPPSPRVPSPLHTSLLFSTHTAPPPSALSSLPTATCTCTTNASQYKYKCTSIESPPSLQSLSPPSFSLSAFPSLPSPQTCSRAPEEEPLPQSWFRVVGVAYYPVE